MGAIKSVICALFLGPALAVVSSTLSNAEESKTGSISNDIISPTVDTVGEHLGNIKAAGRSATRQIGKKTARYLSIFKPLTETVGAHGWGKDVPDYVGISKAWVDFWQSGWFVAAGGLAGGGLGSLAGPPGSYIGAGVGGYIGGVVYNATIGEVTDEIADIEADKASDRKEKKEQKKRRERVEKIKRQKKFADDYYRKRCEEYRKNFERDPRSIIHELPPNMKRCLELGVDVSRSEKCPKHTRWHKYLQKCASNYDFFVYCKNKYPGSRPALKAPSLCACPKGSKWNGNRSRCIDKEIGQRTKTSGKFAALCAIAKGGNPTFVWDRRGRRYGCQDPRLGSKNFSARKTPIIVGVPAQVKGIKVDCPVSSWPPKHVRVKCVPKNARSPKPGYCATYKLYHVNNRITQKYCYYIH